MGALDSSFPALASALVGAFGTTVQVAVMRPGGYDPATRTASPSSATEYVNGVLENYEAREVGGLVKAGDVRIHIAASDMTEAPSTGDEVRVAGVTRRVVSVRTEYAGGTPALYTLQARV